MYFVKCFYKEPFCYKLYLKNLLRKLNGKYLLSSRGDKLSGVFRSENFPNQLRQFESFENDFDAFPIIRKGYFFVLLDDIGGTSIVDENRNGQPAEQCIPLNRNVPERRINTLST